MIWEIPVVVVEHDENAILSADYLVDMGPGAGIHGGQVVASGTPEQVMKAPSLTGQYLTGFRQIEIPDERRKGHAGQKLVISGARENNLKNVKVVFPPGHSLLHHRRFRRRKIDFNSGDAL